MKTTKFMTRIFSAQENEEELLLNQVQDDIEVALEDGELDAEQYSIKKLSDSTVLIHDKVNDEDTKAEVQDNEIKFLCGDIKKFSEVAAVVMKSKDGGYYVASVENEEDWKRIDSYKDEGDILIKKCTSTQEADKYIEDHGWPRYYSKNFSEIKNADEFREYAHKVMKEAHGDEYSEEVTNKVVDDLIKDNPNADWGELVGRLTSGFGQKNFSEVDEFLAESVLSAQGRINIKRIAEHYNIDMDKAAKKCYNFIKDYPLKEDWGNWGSIDDEEKPGVTHATSEDKDQLLKFIKMCANREGVKDFSDADPTPNQEGADYDLRTWVESHPGQAKYVAELGAKWGVDNILEGLDHDMGETKNESKKTRRFSEA